MTDETITIRIDVNGEWHSVVIDPDDVLLDVLRDRLGLTGTKYNCLQGECGACTVLMNGTSVNSCLVLAAAADGSHILTIEGLGDENEQDPIQYAFMERDGSQCGYCTPGMIMSSKALLSKNQAPSREEIVEALSGNLCRCTGYKHIIEAVESAAEQMRMKQTKEPHQGEEKQDGENH